MGQIVPGIVLKIQTASGGINTAGLGDYILKKKRKSFLGDIIPSGRFARSVTILASGSITSQAIVILASPLIARLYSPSDFGVLGVYASLLGILSVIASLRYQLAIPIARTDGSAANVLVLALTCVVIVSFLTLLLVIGFREGIARMLNMPALTSYLWLLPAGVGLLGAYQALSYWTVREKAFGEITRTKIQQSIGMVVTQLGFGLVGAGSAIGLIVGQIVGQSAGIIRLAVGAKQRSNDVFNRIRWRRIWWTARRYRRFPMYSSWGGFMNRAGAQFPPILLAAYFGPAVAGIYYLVSRVLHVPLILTGEAIGKALHIRAVEAARAKALPQIVLGVFSGLAVIGVVPIVVFGFVAPQFFETIFGARWSGAGQYAQWLVPLLMGTYLRSPLSSLTSALELQIQALAFQGSLLLVRVCGLLIGILKDDPIVAIAGFSLGSLLVNLIFLHILLRSTGLAVRDWLPYLMKLTVFGLSVGATIVLFSETFWSEGGGDSALLIMALLFTGTWIVFQMYRMSRAAPQKSLA